MNFNRNRIYFAATVILGAALSMPQGAWASRARTMVLGDGTGGQVLGGMAGSGNSGSLMYDTYYNHFYNPALIVSQPDWAIIEKSNSQNTAEAGFTTSLLSFKLGGFFNRPLSGSYGASMAPVDIVFGADMLVKWGLGFTYAQGDAANKYAGIRLGFSYLGIEPFFGTSLMGNSSTVTKNSDLLTGVRYRFGEWTPHFTYRKNKIGTADTNSTKTWGFGIGRHFDLAQGAKMNWGFSYWNRSLGTSSATHLFPIEISVEAEATSWLTLRGGFTFSKSNSAARVGSGIMIGKASFDWVFGLNNVVLGSTESGEKVDTTNLGFGPGFFSAASLSYEW